MDSFLEKFGAWLRPQVEGYESPPGVKKFREQLEAGEIGGVELGDAILGPIGGSIKMLRNTGRIVDLFRKLSRRAKNPSGAATGFGYAFRKSPRVKEMLREGGEVIKREFETSPMLSQERSDTAFVGQLLREALEEAEGRTPKAFSYAKKVAGRKAAEYLIGAKPGTLAKKARIVREAYAPMKAKAKAKVPEEVGTSRVHKRIKEVSMQWLMKKDLLSRKKFYEYFPPLPIKDVPLDVSSREGQKYAAKFIQSHTRGTKGKLYVQRYLDLMSEGIYTYEDYVAKKLGSRKALVPKKGGI